MPVYIGDYVADTMHLSTEQRGADLILLFHLWRSDTLHENDIALAQIAGLTTSASGTTRPVLADFFETQDGLWHHGRVQWERTRVKPKQQSNSNKAKSAAPSTWSKPALLPEMGASSITSGNAKALQVFSGVRNASDSSYADARALWRSRQAMEKRDNRAVTVAHVRNITEIDRASRAMAYALAERTFSYWPTPGHRRRLAGWSEETWSRTAVHWASTYPETNTERKDACMASGHNRRDRSYACRAA
jgi:uncharacterized protein YdaU (DUF1376 family)